MALHKEGETLIYVINYAKTRVSKVVAGERKSGSAKQVTLHNATGSSFYAAF